MLSRDTPSSAHSSLSPVLGPSPKKPLHAKRGEICLKNLDNRCMYGPSCHRLHLDPTETDLHSSDVITVNLPPRELFRCMKQTPALLYPSTFDDRLSICSTPYYDDTGSEDSYDGSISVKLAPSGAHKVLPYCPDSDTESSNGDTQDPCPSRICREWCKGVCNRHPCRFLHIKHKHLSLNEHVSVRETEKHPHPQSEEICWAWQTDWCTRGYDCDYVHGDLSYASPVQKDVALPADTPQKYPRPRNNALCEYWLRGHCHRGPTCPWFHGDVSYDDPPEWPLPDEGPANQLLHPRPQETSICRRSQKGLCELGYDCKYVHDDLIYDELIPGFHTAWPSIPHAPVSRTHVPAPQLSYTSPAAKEWTTSVHDHIKIKLSAGFNIESLETGFDSAWVFLEKLPTSISEKKLLALLSPFGNVEIKNISRSEKYAKVKAKYTEHLDALNASASLDNTPHFGGTIRAYLSVKASGRVGALKECTVRLQWDAPSLVGYGGYLTLEGAQEAISYSRKSFQGRHIRAQLFTGLPAVGPYTVRFCNLPESTTKEDMKVFSQPINMVWEPLAYTSVSEAAGSIRRLLTRRFEVLGWEMTSPPYRDGYVRVFARFSNATTAAQAAAHLHLRKPPCLGGNHLYALHLRELTFQVAAASYKRIAEDVYSMRDQSNRNTDSTSVSGLNVNHGQQGDFYFVTLFSNDSKELGRLKREFETIQRGQVVKFEDKIAWDAYFNRPSGIVFLQTIQRRHAELLVVPDPIRRRITLHGPLIARAQVEVDIARKLKELRQRKARVVPIPGYVLGRFMASEFPKLKRELGEETVSIDLWNRNLIVRGTSKQWVEVKQAVQRASDRQHPSHSAAKAAVCPICFNDVASPCTFACGHTHCRSCLKEYLLAAIDSRFFPLTCLGDEANCTERLPLAAAKDILSTAEFDAVVTSAYTAYVAMRPSEFRPCPTPDCPQVFRPGPPGNVLQCPACLAGICSTCHGEDHEGVACPDVEGQEAAFKEWKSSHDVKARPGCTIDIVRSEGCNHVTCTRCQTHICWVCSSTFPRGEGIYDHLRLKHGGIGILPHF